MTATTFTWYGHACLEIRTGDGRTILVDPWFGNPASPRAAHEMGTCDLMLVTHGHDDHMGDAIALASRLRPAWPCIHEMSLWLGRRLPGGSEATTGMNKGGTVEVAGCRVTMVRAEHSAGAWDPGNETILHLGEPVGFVVDPGEERRFYVAGDTDVFGDMRLIADLHRPSVAILPIGGHYTMGPHEAALAVELLRVDDVIPVHYGTYPILAGTPDALRSALAARGLGHVRVHALDPGGSVSLA